MKNKIIVVAVLLLTTFTISEAQIRFGIKAGASITNLTNAHSTSKSRTGYQIGGLALIPIDNKDQFYFEPEVIYSAQGEFNVNRDPRINQKTYLSFINVPLNLRAYLSESENEIYGVFGPYIGFKVGENIEKFDFPTEPDDEKYSSFDFGLGLGGGFSLNRQFEIEARYSYGFVDQIEHDASDSNNHTSILSFGLSYVFQ